MPSSPRSILRARLARGEAVVAPGAYDPIGARVIAHLGFPAIYTGGYMTGAHLAVTEPLMTMTEQLEVARRVALASDLPVIVDGDAGYGDPLHTMRTVVACEDAGVAGVHIEDQVFPKHASYHMGLEHVTPGEEFLEKMRYALRARRDPDFLIIARTDAFSAVGGSMEEAVRRGRALQDLGVDAILPRGVRSREDLARFRKGVPGIPLMVIAGADDISATEYADLGYQLVIYATTPIIAAAYAYLDVYTRLRDTGMLPLTAAEVAEKRRFVEQLIGLPEYYRIEAETTERRSAAERAALPGEAGGEGGSERLGPGAKPQ